MPDSDARPLTAEELEAYRELGRFLDVEPFKQPAPAYPFAKTETKK